MCPIYIRSSTEHVRLHTMEYKSELAIFMLPRACVKSAVFFLVISGFQIARVAPKGETRFARKFTVGCV